MNNLKPIDQVKREATQALYDSLNRVQKRKMLFGSGSKSRHTRKKKPRVKNKKRRP